MQNCRSLGRKYNQNLVVLSLTQMTHVIVTGTANCLYCQSLFKMSHSGLRTSLKTHVPLIRQSTVFHSTSSVAYLSLPFPVFPQGTRSSVPEVHSILVDRLLMRILSSLNAILVFRKLPSFSQFCLCLYKSSAVDEEYLMGMGNWRNKLVNYMFLLKINEENGKVFI